MNRTLESNTNIIPSNSEEHDVSPSYDEACQQLEVMNDRYHRLSSEGDYHDIETLRDMRRLKLKIDIARTSLERFDVKVA